MSTAAPLPPSPIPLFTTVASFREWRAAARRADKSVGFVPTMGALHDGHMSLVRRSLAENDLTVLSIFVNPAQFAPHEDLATYPRTLPRDLEILAAQAVAVDSTTRGASAVFLPSVQEMYPSGIAQDPRLQRGTFVEVAGYGAQMEGRSRPTFFRGVATVVTKLFNAIEPTNAYFGQKDIQQCLVLKRLCADLLLAHPDPAHLHIVPTARDPADGLALSSRNAYLSPPARKLAPALYRALQAAADAWAAGEDKAACVRRAEDVVAASAPASNADSPDTHMRLDYIEFNDADSLEPLDGACCIARAASTPVVLSGALWIGTTRLIDNIVLGDLR
ncbi:Pantoate-beta-alanine ligase [Mycena rosella]|uniref:Pantoate--beta-alanine ligase n=1 Tax=Mycena rosella TaxID=1033263 RepID=A0AAD7DQ48_MYCRO|nr:Pantoate-beta-alanine ligase [Mycena rosella]